MQLQKNNFSVEIEYLSKDRGMIQFCYDLKNYHKGHIRDFNGDSMYMCAVFMSKGWKFVYPDYPNKESILELLKK